MPKSEAGERTVPVPSLVINALKEWRLACPKRNTGRKDANGEPIKELHYVFPNGKGRVENQTNIVRRHWHPLQVGAGVWVDGDVGITVIAQNMKGHTGRRLRRCV